MFRLTREQAYELAWSAPMTTLAAEVEVSNVGLAKSLREAGIPLPERGYWNKLSAGKPAKRISLTPPHLGTRRLVFVAGNMRGSVRQRITGEPGERAEPWETTDELRARFESQMPRLALPKSSGWQHHGVKRLLTRDRAIIAKRDAAGETFSQFFRPKFADPLQARKLRFINALAYAMEKVGGGLGIRDDTVELLNLSIGDGHATCRVVVNGRGLTVTDPEHDGSKGRWTDQPGDRLESHLNEIVVSIALACWQNTIRRHEDAIKGRKAEEERIRAIAEQARQAAERSARKAHKKQLRLARKKLVSAARGADEATLIRAYVAEGRKRFAGKTSTEELEAWAEWALGIADELDPWAGDKAMELFRQATDAIK